MAVGDIVSRLAGVKSTGPDRWIARCPAHQDKHPSMTVRGLPDGRILMHCFAGCDPGAILDAIGLTFSDLFSEPLARDGLKPIRAPFSAHEALQCLREESAIVAFAAADLSEGTPLSHRDAARVALAAGRIASALEGVHGG